VYLHRSLSLAGAFAFGAALLLAGCGGGSGAAQTFATVRGPGFVFPAPSDWPVKRSPTSASASPKPVSPELVSVAVFPLARAYKPSLYELEVKKELDPNAAQLAAQQHGAVKKRADVNVAGMKARQYLVDYTRNGKDLSEQITFVFRGKKEYELLCQWESSSSQPDFCTRLTAGFRPA
jgi:hypothetical protein